MGGALPWAGHCHGRGIAMGIALQKLVLVGLVLNIHRTYVADGIHSQYNAPTLPHA